MPCRKATSREHGKTGHAAGRLRGAVGAYEEGKQCCSSGRPRAQAAPMAVPIQSLQDNGSVRAHVVTNSQINGQQVWAETVALPGLGVQAQGQSNGVAKFLVNHLSQLAVETVIAPVVAHRKPPPELAAGRISWERMWGCGLSAKGRGRRGCRRSREQEASRGDEKSHQTSTRHEGSTKSLRLKLQMTQRRQWWRSFAWHVFVRALETWALMGFGGDASCAYQNDTYDEVVIRPGDDRIGRSQLFHLHSYYP